jgi:hypothetical protein
MPALTLGLLQLPPTADHRAPATDDRPPTTDDRPPTTAYAATSQKRVNR